MRLSSMRFERMGNFCFTCRAIWISVLSSGKAPIVNCGDTYSGGTGEQTRSLLWLSEVGKIARISSTDAGNGGSRWNDLTVSAETGEIYINVNNSHFGTVSIHDVNQLLVRLLIKVRWPIKHDLNDMECRADRRSCLTIRLYKIWLNKFIKIVYILFFGTPISFLCIFILNTWHQVIG